MKRLHELNDELENIDNLIESIESDGIQTDMNDCIAELLEQRKESYEEWLTKIDNYCAVITNRFGLSRQRKAEAERLKKLAAEDEKKVEWLKLQLKNALERQNIKKLSLPRFQLSVAKNGGVQPLIVRCEPSELPFQFQRVEISPDNSSIRKALEAGDETVLKFAKFGERETHIRVK